MAARQDLVPRLRRGRRRWRNSNAPSGLVEDTVSLKSIFIPLIRARGGSVCSYVGSLLELSIPDDGGRQLTKGEIVSLCSEFLTVGTDTTTTALEWTMAELVKNPKIQGRLAEEIENVVGAKEKVEEEDLQGMPYLKAVVLEGLRRHPPGPPRHFVLPHMATEDIEVGGYVVPKDASVNVMAADLGMDEKIWSDPTEFRPERFLAGGEAEDVDITGSREIMMMPFGVGRRICPGLGLAMLHLEYFVANLVREFEWKAVEGDEVDLSETLELTVVMKNHLRTRIFPRRRKTEINVST
ncbi:cytochrome P450 89A2-like [Asparagus officinalis]|uniref:cytochrome P450 89A2-like n=1 Tax=Asparagus officinalis TaxID=4686 RepID=UPI00098DEB08|nr:cytochrome P450 89A2-like [Asparagus officinalis]